ncbi:transcription initiation factor IIA, gamma subunit [Microthyrium microscopicum]|uniref:Transcription initiation factor IIA subunit 2 n=1 Tax=Microthyrium microscopicum TaxID=703497 RepID=A0A6A6ULD1_9PEZI|nr:transcription initiation factor IIA, gamma subunit [Microthyrium microscopicum]
MSAPNSAYYELYRRSSIGNSLVDALDAFIADRRIEPQIAIKMLEHFDRVVAEVLSDKVKSRLSFKGHLDTYRFCDDVWTFIVKDITFKLDNQSPLTSEKIKIVAMNSKKPGEA